MKKIIKNYLKGVVYLFSKQILIHLSSLLCEVGKAQEIQLTYSSRNLKPLLYRGSRGYQHTGILIQGSVPENDIELLELAKSYRNLYPDVQIVVSTWQLSQKLTDLLYQAGVTIVSSTDSIYSGTGNVNLQIHTTRTGLTGFKNHIEFVLKTRTDMQVYDYKSLDFLISTFERHGYHEGVARIIVPSFNTMKYRCYSASDQLQFSTKDRLMDFWNCDFMTEAGNPVFNTDGEYPGISRPLWAKNGIQFAEEYLVTQDMMRRGVWPDYTLKQSLKVYRDSFIIVNESNLDLVWKKNSSRDLTNRSKYQNLEVGLRPLLDWEWQDLNQDFESFYLQAKNELDLNK
jgi:hypothetical protein